MREDFVEFLRKLVPQSWWSRIWWLAPLTCLLLIPLGLLVLEGLTVLGWVGAPRAMQGLMLFAIVAGPVVGSAVLLTVRKARLNDRRERVALWLARLAIPGPLATVLLLFWIVRRIYGD